MKKPTLKDYTSLSSNTDIPLEKRLTAKQLTILRKILLGKSPSLTMVTGSRCAGRSSVLSVASLLHALHGDGDVLVVSANQERSRLCVRYGIQQWINTVSPRPYEWGIQHSPLLAFICEKTKNFIYIESMESLRRIHDPYRYYTRYRNVRLIWFEDLDLFPAPTAVPYLFASRDIETPCKIAINYQIHEWRDDTSLAVSMLKQLITSTHTLMVDPKFTRPEIYHELRRVEAARRQMLKASNFYKKRDAAIKKLLD